jgi:hypothetical protein
VDLDDAVEDMIEDIAASAANSHPDVTVDTVIKRASPVDTLTDRSADADLIDLGGRGSRRHRRPRRTPWPDRGLNRTDHRPRLAFADRA